MICEKLPTIYVVTKNNDVFEYVVDQTNFPTLEDINNFIKKEYGDKFKELRLGNTVGYLRKPNYEK